MILHVRAPDPLAVVGRKISRARIGYQRTRTTVKKIRVVAERGPTAGKSPRATRVRLGSFKSQSPLEGSNCTIAESNSPNGLPSRDPQRRVRRDRVQCRCAARRTDGLPVVTKSEDVNQGRRESVGVLNGPGLPVYKSRSYQILE